MRSNFLLRARKWIGASALAILVGIGGGTAFVATTSQLAVAQAKVTPAAQINVPAVNEPGGFADLVEAVKPAVVSIVVEAREKGSLQDFRQDGGGEFNFNFP